MPMSDMTFEQFQIEYSTEEKCAEALFSARWPDGFECPRCAHRQYSVIRTRRLPLFECLSCRRQTSLIAGTIFECSRTPLTLWFKALFLHARPEGISATRLASLIGTTYKTAWLICHKIRHAMTSANSGELLSGLVRVNCAMYGRPYNPTIFRHPQQHPLLIGGTIGPNRSITHVKIRQVPDHQLVHDCITRGAGHDFIQKHVDPAVQDVPLVVQSCSPNRYAPLLRIGTLVSNWIKYTFNGIGSKHLQSYLDQFCFGFNARNRSSADLFANLLHHGVLTTPLSYPNLIRREDHSARRKRNYYSLLQKAS